MSASCADSGSAVREHDALIALRNGDFGKRLFQDAPIRVADSAKLLEQDRLTPALRGERLKSL